MRSLCHFLIGLLGLFGWTAVANGQVATVTGISPSSVAVGSNSFTLAVFGNNFPASAEVTWNSTMLTTTFFTASELTAVVPANLVASPGTVVIAVTGATGSSTFSVVGSSLAITTTSLPGGAVNQAYSQQLTASGGTPPYHWSGQNFPSWLSIGPANGILSGTPPAQGTFTFTIQVTDSASSPASASRSFTLTITGQPLTITTTSLNPGFVMMPYRQTLAASGGSMQGYTWSMTPGSVDGLTLDSSTGVLAGTPVTAGVFPLTIQVTDSAGNQAPPLFFTLTVSLPSLTIVASTTPPNGAVGVAYPSQQFVAVGGTAPYNWTGTGLPPGLTVNALSGVLSGTPTSPGTFSVIVQATDAKGVMGTTPPFTITITARLTITTANQLPGAMLGSAFSYTMTASGGTPPYTWAANGLPSGLAIGARSGVISGTPASAGSIAFTVTVIDSVQSTASDLFQIQVNPAPLPPITVTGLPDTATPLQQYPISVTLGDPYPNGDISGTVILTSMPADSGPSDNSIQFSSGGRSANFDIPAGSTSAPLQIQVGTVAGTIAVTVTQVLAGGLDVTPSPAPVASTQVRTSAPVITAATASSNGNTLTIQIVGYATSREVTQAVFSFSAAAGQSLANSQFSIPMDSTFATYYQNSANAAFGSQFILTQPFSIQGNASGVIPQSVTLTNRVGTTTASVTQ
jgi:Putative Ig domain